MRKSILAALLLLIGPALHARGDIDFNRDVRPILSEHCWRCHGFDEHARQADLRLDVREDVLRVANSGTIAIVPHVPDDSELVARITATDESLRMPPLETHKRLSQTQIQTLIQWIKEGAIYQKHWSLEPITKPPVPPLPGASNPIDAFVAAQLKPHGVDFAPEAAPETLLRRVSFDLTGLPPTIEDLERQQTEAYEQAVDRFLSSPHFGERMAVDWLDTARFADTNGYFGDKPRQVWPWRDWVINAFNRNMPFDQFTVEQLAGDLLPNSSVEQRVATGFNRNHMANNETGIIDEEYRVEYVIDRVDTTMTTWLGLTVGCAQCHDHKYDPITQREYYQLFAFFNNVPERGLLVGNNPAPVMSVPTPKQQRQLAEQATATAGAVASFKPHQIDLATQIAKWETVALKTLNSRPEDSIVLHEDFNTKLANGIRSIGTTLEFTSGVRGQAARFDATQHVEADLPGFDADAPWSIGLWVMPDGPLSCVLSKIEPQGERRGIEMLWRKGRLIVNLVSRWGISAIELATVQPVKAQEWHQIVVCYDGMQRADGVQVSIDGETISVDVRRDTLDGSIATTEPLRIGRRDSGLGFYGRIDELRLQSTTLTEAAVVNGFWGERIRGIVETPQTERTNQDNDVLLGYYVDRFADQETRDARDRVNQMQEAERELKASIPTTLVMQEMPRPRVTTILERGQYDQPGEAVDPGVPAAFSSWPVDAERNRLGFAEWVVADDNPLTARVAVNRLWAQCFGVGLVRTMNDFGTQGEPPTHPELLDWLAATFRESGWDVKALLRQIVTSRTYRQSSRFRFGESEVLDPDNRLLVRGPSFRMPMEMIRDQALAASGLLVPIVGGPSVKPYQPPGLWEEVSYNGEETYEPDRDHGRWRRSLYTFIKRQAPPPTLLLFDGPTREKCTVQRARTNTPLQALVLLNDETYIEAARALVSLTLDVASQDREMLRQLWRRVLSRSPSDDELRKVEGLLQRQRMRFAADSTTADDLVAVGASRTDTRIDPPELAAWTVVAHTLFNLDEAIMRR